MGSWKKVIKDTQRREVKHITASSELAHSGHSPLYKKALSKNQKKQLRDIGFCDVMIRGEEKRVTRDNLVGGKYFVHWYIRSDTEGVALRNYAMDAARSARHRAPAAAGMLGD